MQIHAEQGCFTGSILLDGQEIGHTCVYASEELGVAICLVTEDDRKPYQWWETGEPETPYSPPLTSRRLYFSDFDVNIHSPVLMQLYGKVEIIPGEIIPRERPSQEATLCR